MLQVERTKFITNKNKKWEITENRYCVNFSVFAGFFLFIKETTKKINK